jgi:hypothetical protein
MTRFVGSLKHGPASAKLIAAFEKRIGAKLPADYKKFLKEHNGGRPRPNGFQFDGGEEWGVECFFPLREFDPAEVRDVGFDDLVNWPVQCAWDDLQTDLQGLYADCDLDNQGYQLDRLLPIGTDGYSNYFCLVLAGDETGSLVFFDHETACVTPLADSFQEFVTGLRRFRSNAGE